MICTKKRLRICIALLILILTFIWGNSLLPGEVSGAFSDWVRDLLATLFTGENAPSGGGGLLRKLAHFTEFAALGMCLCWLTGMLRKAPIQALLGGFLVACVDETIQCFVPNRGPGLLDVGLDTCGAAVGIALLLTAHTLIKKYIGGK